MKHLFASLLCTLGLLTPLLAAPAPSTPKAYPANGANYRRFDNATPPLLPLPQRVEWAGTALLLTEMDYRIDASALPATEQADGRLALLRAQLAAFFRAHELADTPGGYAIRVQQGTPEGLPKDAPAWQKAEAYALCINKDGICITTEGMRGLLNASQTLKQLMLRRRGKTTLAACHITDWPDLQIRAVMNDIGRNYMPPALLREVIDSLALLKYNTYHLHLTDDPGWRLESKIYPQLNRNLSKPCEPGIYMTQEEFCELVEYCRLRGIQLIPEMDMPGHCAAFRKALGISDMKDPRATEALEKLIAELASLVPAEQMPYIHIGTDEARESHEKVGKDELRRYYAAVEKAGRTPIRWQPGLTHKDFQDTIEQLWMGRHARQAWPTPGGRYIDSHETYVNHLDPFETASTFYFRRPCPFPDAEGLGFTLCSWPDLPIRTARNQLLQTPIFPAMAFCSQAIWNSPHPKLEGDPMQDELMCYFSNLPRQGTPLLKGFAECESRVLAIRDRFFVNKEFNYLRQSHVPWRIIGPFPHGGNTDKVFAPERELLAGKAPSASYREGGHTYRWHEGEYTGHTLIFKHYCDYPTLFNNGGFSFLHKDSTFYALQYIWSPREQKVPFWVSGHTWATSDWHWGPVSVPGKWFHANPKFWVNGKEIRPPKWQKPGNSGPMMDENYHFRKPTMIPLKKGWNQVLVKSPNNARTRRWMFTFAPVQVNPATPGRNVKEYPGLKFATSPKK